MLKKQKIYIIDGYNVLRNGERYASYAGNAPNFKDWTSDISNSAREALFNDVSKMIDGSTSAIIVYDAAKRKDNFNSLKNQNHSHKNIQVIFTDYGESADDRIQKIVSNCKSKGMDIKVVTSDLGIQNSTIGKGVFRMSSREFEIYATDNELEQKQDIKTKSNSQINLIEKELNLSHSKLENVVDSNLAKKLRDLRDSL